MCFITKTAHSTLFTEIDMGTGSANKKALTLTSTLISAVWMQNTKGDA